MSGDGNGSDKIAAAFTNPPIRATVPLLKNNCENMHDSIDRKGINFVHLCTIEIYFLAMIGENYAALESGGTIKGHSVE
jgi:hypothetical protein